jgi:TM2 domain-containing membrane protein YozV
MDCVNHSGINATAYCQSCGKALCPGCVRNAAGGQVLCEPCWMAWQSYQQPFIPPVTSGPNPPAAAALGLIPGVGAMYNGQFIKGFIHVAIFAVLCALANYNDYFGFGVAAWIIYQAFEAYHTAKALRDGLPLPDPLGLNEVGSRLNWSTRMRNPGQPGVGQGPAGEAAANGQPPSAGEYQPPNQAAYQQGPYQSPYQTPFTPPPVCCRRSEPIGAIVLIALGIMFLLGQLDVFHGRLFEFAWPVLLIALGVWLIVRRMGDSQGGSK